MVLREVIEEHNFANQLKELEKTFERIYEVRDAVAWLLARDPNYGDPLPDDDEHRVIETSPLLIESPQFWVMYRMDEESQKVFLVSITMVPDDANHSPE